MDFALVFKELISRFEAQQINYALIGGFALHVSGFTRATNDIDFLVDNKDLDSIRVIMKQLGYECVHQSAEFSNYWHPMAPLGCVDYLHAHRDYACRMLGRARRHTILETFTVPVLIAEDIIGLKVQAIANNPDRRSLDMADIEYLLKHKQDTLDMTLIREYFDLFGFGPELDAILGRSRHDQ